MWWCLVVATHRVVMDTLCISHDLSCCSTFLCHAQFPKLIYCWWVLQVLHVTVQMLDYFALWRGFPWLVCIFSSPCTSLFLRVIRGGNGLVDGPVIPENLEKAMKKIAEEGFAHKQQVHANLLYLVWYYLLNFEPVIIIHVCQPGHWVRWEVKLKKR